MTSKGETISRVRTLIKGVKSDAFLTDRFLYSLVLKYAKLFIKRLDDENKLGRYNSIFQKLPGVELEEISRIEACINIDSCCTFRRSKEKLPKILEGSFGLFVRTITSIDGSFICYETTSKLYNNMLKSATFKYNKNIYFWIAEDRIIFPNVEWNLIDVEALWQDDIDMYKCDAGACPGNKLDERSNIPESLFPDIENGVRQELLNMLQIPKDNLQDNQSILKS